MGWVSSLGRFTSYLSLSAQVDYSIAHDKCGKDIPILRD